MSENDEYSDNSFISVKVPPEELSNEKSEYKDPSETYTGKTLQEKFNILQEKYDGLKQELIIKTNLNKVMEMEIKGLNQYNQKLK